MIEAEVLFIQYIRSTNTFMKVINPCGSTHTQTLTRGRNVKDRGEL